MHISHSSIYLIASIISLLMISCRKNEIKCCIDNWPSSSVYVYGTVSDSSGKPVAGSKVQVTHFPMGCDSLAGEYATYKTNEEGMYSGIFVIIGSGQGPSPCYTASAIPPDSAQYEPASDTLPASLIKHFKSKPPYDSMQVDFVLKGK